MTGRRERGQDAARAMLEVAARSDQPAVADAVRRLAVLVRLAEPGMLRDTLQLMRLCPRAAGFDRAEVHTLVDAALDRGGADARVAVENLLDVARLR